MVLEAERVGADSQQTSSVEILPFWAYIQPTLEVLHERGGSATVQELLAHVAVKMGLSEHELLVPHAPGRDRPSEVAYRMAWARTYLKKSGLIDNSNRGVWTLTPAGQNTERVDGQAIAREIRGGPRGGDNGAPNSANAKVYLFAWNPTRSGWGALEDQIQAIRDTGTADDEWSCGHAKHIPPGSRFFLIRLGLEPRGIVGSGVTVDEVREAAHWNDDRASHGETANFVDVRFDVLSRTPLIHRADLDDPPFDDFRWDTQMSGVRLPDDLAAKLEEEWQKRLETQARGESPPLLADHIVSRWRDFWEEARSDVTWLERHRLRDAKRWEALPQIHELVVQFLKGEIALGEYRDTFDRKTRNEWDLFGLKGMSGAMFLNKLAKHLPDQNEVAEKLRRAIDAPASDAEAREKLSAFMAYLDDQIEAGVTTGAVLQPNQAPFFVSACWHVQKPDQWPIIYQSARKALQADGILGRNVKGADGYLEYVRIFRALADGISIPFWELEHLCARLESSLAFSDDEGNRAEDLDETPQKERVWLFAPGRGAKLFDDFYTQGIVAIGWDYLGDLSQYPAMEAIREAIQKRRGGDTNPVHNTLTCYQFAHEMEVGDVVFAKRGRKEIVGYGIITSKYRYEPQREHYIHVRSVDWKMRGEWVARERPLVTKTLTDISNYPALIADIHRAIGMEAGAEPEAEREVTPAPGYTLDDALQELFLAREDVEEAVALLHYKKNLVLQGPPGVGKTLFAKRLAYLLLGEKDPDRAGSVPPVLFV